ncbi:ABC-type nitrate/sulfonate/bicarbonate transport system, substrate-binding protein [Tistlia consotensis]|uniref:ABC-type nitrate/sulfonate/bicarbonate transport system, substrate-binding protein n=1 Tax=Tistlia consotensis USBA 355 TaxID=560819 RepID=A0A1Y6C7L4_9PROT|nr:NrtA/SsuA/CpmA family ABC transporter substrate-binding protein [Tistlia consotensis]SMF49040.1 ABC-type nitrate/sulfonate/bicarbonate transport system, substrate-binding protein [Tistlia consotensis USBA 355]SNR80510.1 ABC-type nitrate/sulfonate/bicarbonate transport system, substrate-binding protein [Tistlia consotensis]
MTLLRVLDGALLGRLSRSASLQLLTAAALAAGLLASPAGAAGLTKVRAGHLVALDMAPLFVAKESGCFEKAGLDVETVFFANPGDNNAALAGGAIDFSTNPFTLPFFAANSGVPIRVIAAAGGWGVMEVVAQAKTGLTSIADIKAYIAAGKPKLKIATLQGDTLELILTRAFKQAGIDPADTEFVYFNDLLAMVEAFRSGQVDILSHIKPYTSDMVVNKGAKVLTTNAATWTPFTPNTVVSVLQKTLDQRPEVVKAYLEGLVCGAKIINETPEKAVELLSKGTYFRVGPEVLLASFKSAPAPISFVPDLDSIQSVVDDLTALGYIKGGVKATDIFRLETIKSIEQ